MPTKRFPAFRALDLRPLMAQGEEPLHKIMTAVTSLAPNEGLALTAPFLPSPLIEQLRADGYSVRTDHRPDGSWTTFFWRS
ncbi:MAG TPA: DUF2249 domain-containing protein [Opitutaceae bacterium]|nr:DUF2249 domain-containing protein [Opitutaceae bacterium]